MRCFFECPDLELDAERVRLGGIAASVRRLWWRSVRARNMPLVAACRDPMSTIAMTSRRADRRPSARLCIESGSGGCHRVASIDKSMYAPMWRVKRYGPSGPMSDSTNSADCPSSQAPANPPNIPTQIYNRQRARRFWPRLRWKANHGGQLDSSIDFNRNIPTARVI